MIEFIVGRQVILSLPRLQHYRGTTIKNRFCYYLLALVLVESPAQQFDVLRVFGQADTALFTAIDYAPVLE